MKPNLIAIAFTIWLATQTGVSSQTPTDQDNRANLDDKGQKKQPPRIQELDDVRRENVQVIDAASSLNLLVQALATTENPTALLKGILLGLEGQREVAPPNGWQALSAKLSQSPAEDVRRLTKQLSQLFGDEAATRNALATLADTHADIPTRQQALAALLNQQHQDLLPILAKLLDEPILRIPAIRGYSTFESKDAPSILLKHYPEVPPDAKRAILETLATRKTYAEALFEALEADTLPQGDLPAYVARSLSSLLGEKFTLTYGAQTLSQDKEALIAQYKSKATPDALAKADASAGRRVFQNVCMACHRMYEEGGIIGPDLTGSNRADLNYLLLNIFDPSGDMPDAYKMVMITTKSDQLLAGTVTEEDHQRVVLSMIGQKSTVLKSDIKSRETSNVSMMPDGLLQTLKDKEVLDLFKYLQTKHQVDLPTK